MEFSFVVLKILVSAAIIAGISWYAGKNPSLAGFLIALPMISILAISFSYAQYRDIEDQPVCRIDCGEYSALPAFFRAFRHEPVVEVEFLSNHRFGICFVVGGLLDSFTHLQNLTNPPARFPWGGPWETADRCIPLAKPVLESWCFSFWP